MRRPGKARGGPILAAVLFALVGLPALWQVHWGLAAAAGVGVLACALQAPK